ncbi:Voltage-dependent calcium channel type D subunit alpha-1, partial [Orchesella cincta]
DKSSSSSYLSQMIKSQAFYWTIIVLVFLNTVVAATEHYNQPKCWMNSKKLRISFLLCFSLWKMILKMYSLGFSVSEYILNAFYYYICRRYFVSLFNRFDCFATISSIVEIALVKTNVIPPIGVSVLRCVRLLRVFKVTRYWKALSNLVASLLNSIQSIASLLFLLFLFMMIFALLGHGRCLGGKFNNDPTDFKTQDKFRTLFSLRHCLPGDMNRWRLNGRINVTSLKKAAIGGGGLGQGISRQPFNFIRTVFVNYNFAQKRLLAPLAVGAQLGRCGNEVEQRKMRSAEESPASQAGRRGRWGSSRKRRKKREKRRASIRKEEGRNKKMGKGRNLDNRKESVRDATSRASKTLPKMDFTLRASKEVRTCRDSVKMGSEKVPKKISNMPNPDSECLGDLEAERSPLTTLPAQSKLLKQNSDLNFFQPTVFTMRRLVSKKTDLYGSSSKQKGRHFCRGFCQANISRDWFRRSACSLIFSFFLHFRVQVSFSNHQKISQACVRCSSVPSARYLIRAKGLKRVIQCMIVAIKTIGNIVIVTNLLQFMYAVIGVQLFKGALFECTDPSKKSLEECQGEFIAYDDGKTYKPIVEDREWVNNPFNFDSVPNGMLTLFAVSTFEGWPQMLYKSIDSAGENQGPIYNNRMLVAAFYISYLIVISFFMINIFVGFVILTFQNEGEQEYKHCDLEKNQRNCLEFALNAKPIKKYIPTNRFQYQVWSIVSSQPFDYISFGLIILNTISLGMKFYNQPAWYTEFLEYGNIFFTIAFTIELVLKLLAFGVKMYCNDTWNVFDFLIVVGSYIDIIFAEVNISFFRLFRVGRLIKLLNKSEGIRTILWTFIKSLQALPYVILLIVLLFFIYAIVGMQIFGKIALDEASEIHRNNNFQTFGNAVLLLFRCATGEAWQEVMLACSGGEHVKCFHPPLAEEKDECGNDFAFPYFISFFVSCSFLVLNLFVAVIMDNFDYLTRDWSILGAHHLGEFIQHWSEYDPDATGKIRHDDVVNLLRKINPPLGFGRLCPRRRACKRLVAMNMPMNPDGTVNFNATIFALVRTGLQVKTEGNIMEADAELRRTLLSLWRDVDPRLLNQVVPPPEVLDEVTVGKFYASVLIQEQYRKYHRKKMKCLEDEGQGGKGGIEAFKLQVKLISFWGNLRQFGSDFTVVDNILQAGLRMLHEKDPKVRRRTSAVLVPPLGNEFDVQHRVMQAFSTKRNHLLFGKDHRGEKKSRLASKIAQLTGEREDIAFSLETGQFLYRPRNKYIQEEDLSHITILDKLEET